MNASSELIYKKNTETLKTHESFNEIQFNLHYIVYTTNLAPN